MSGEQLLIDLLTKLVDGKNEQDTRLESLLTAIKNPPPPDAAAVRADKVLKITTNISKSNETNVNLSLNENKSKLIKNRL